ncbi:hypothetical protein MSG28_015691 [Choristoneura fumiferana]|uniref:Uncharacterized protein n=1 Tax=Choristoneura fumiferana TaxID=7141 RepID=A0ACC0KB47_CHOFU|nr:hypothetical protein MSG28_015691 [Choristoneura fumiferana]
MVVAIQADLAQDPTTCKGDSKDELLDLCQRCAKLTKSRLAYPACCSTDLQARKWCSDYVYFGRGQYDFYLV